VGAVGVAPALIRETAVTPADPTTRRWAHPALVVLGVLRDILHRLLTLEVVDRSLVVGAQAFSALIPLLIVLASVGAGDGSSFGDSLVRRFDLDGDAARVVHETFATPADGAGLTTASIVIVTLSALAFTRALQRTYELAWGLERRGMRSTGWGLAWLALLAVYGALFPVVQDTFSGAVGAVIGLATAFGLWLTTPYMLLSRRLSWHTLWPQAALTAVGMTVLSIGSAIYVPRAMGAAADDFGAIGVAFTLLSILWAGGFVIVCAAGIGSFIRQTPSERAETLQALGRR
jgi:membrane protein